MKVFTLSQLHYPETAFNNTRTDSQKAAAQSAEIEIS